MKETIEARLAELRAEFETGQRVLAELEEKREKLWESMLRIAGAIQVLEEIVNQGSESHANENLESENQLR